MTHESHSLDVYFKLRPLPTETDVYVSPPHFRLRQRKRRPPAPPKNKEGRENAQGAVHCIIVETRMVTMKRKLIFPPKLRRRMYTDKQIAQALQILSELKNNQLASEKTGTPRSTLNLRRMRYQAGEEFSQRIDLLLAES